MAYLRLNISNLCNFSCKYCHVFKLIDNKFPLKIMDYETISYSIENFIKILKEYGDDFLTLSIYGGETLINKQNLFKAIKKYKTNYEGVNINWMVNTNGSLLTEDVADFFKEYETDVHLSADGFSKIHNKNRTDKFGKDTFDRVEKALQLIKEKKLRAQINSFVFPENVNNLFEIVDLAKKFGIHRIYLDLFYDTKERALPPSLVSAKYFEAYKHGLKNGVKISGPWTVIFEGYTKKKLQNQHRTFHKPAPAINVTVDKTFFFNRCPKMEPIGLERLGYEEFVKNYDMVSQQFNTIVENSCKYCFLKKSCNGTMISQFQYHTRLDNGWKRTCVSTQEIIKLIKKAVPKNEKEAYTS